MLTPIFGHRWWAPVVALAFPFLGVCYSIMLPRSGVEPLSWSTRYLHARS